MVRRARMGVSRREKETGERTKERGDGGREGVEGKK